jgi:hypothetical protein
MAEDQRYSFHTFEHDALARFVALVVAHTRSAAVDVGELDTLLNRMLAEHGIKSIDAFNEAVSRHLDEFARTEVGHADIGLSRPQSQ